MDQENNQQAPVSEAQSTKTPVMQSLRLKNYFLDFFPAFLNMPLSGSETRVRNRFLRLIQPKVEEKELARIDIAKKYADKDDKGIAKENEGHFVMTEENKKKCDEEYLELQNKDFVIDVLPSNVDDLRKVKQLILNTPVKFNLGEGQIYGAICAALEELK